MGDDVGLFAHHEAQPGTIRAAGDEAVAQDAALRTLADSIERRAQKAASETSGILATPMTTVHEPVKAATNGLAAVALLAGGCLRSFADAVDTYNTTIDGLNERWETATGNDFGVAADAGHTADGTPAENDAARAEAVSSAKAALKAQLESEERTARTECDDIGDEMAGMLGQGPSPDTLGYFALTGALPASALAAHLGLAVDEVKDYKTLGTQLMKAFKLGKTAREAFHMLAQTDLKKAKDLIKQDWDELLRRSRWEGVNPLKTWIQDHSDHLARATALTDAANDARMARLAGLVYDGSKLAKLGGVLGVVGGGFQIADTISNWDEMSTKDRSLNLVGGSASVISGGGTLLAAAVGVGAIPVAGQVIIVAAGVVAAGVAIYQNWDTIVDVGGKIVDGVKDFVEDPGKAVDSVVEGAKDLGEDIKDAGSSVVEGAKDFFGF